LGTAIQGDRFEIKGGRMALHRSNDSTVRRLARRLVADHTKSLAESIALANQLGINAPRHPNPTMRWELEEISEEHGNAFDHDYAELEVTDHHVDISEAKDEVELGCNNRVQQDAKSEVPTLKEHLKLAKEAAAANPDR